jgi:hypothetical protein
VNSEVQEQPRGAQLFSHNCEFRDSIKSCEIGRAPFGAALDPPAADESDNHHYHNDHQNDMNQASTNMKREPKKPQDQQNNRNSPEHNPELTI